MRYGISPLIVLSLFAALLAPAALGKTQADAIGAILDRMTLDENYTITDEILYSPDNNNPQKQ